MKGWREGRKAGKDRRKERIKGRKIKDLRKNKKERMDSWKEGRKS